MGYLVFILSKKKGFWNGNCDWCSVISALAVDSSGVPIFFEATAYMVIIKSPLAAVLGKHSLKSKESWQGEKSNNGQQDSWISMSTTGDRTCLPTSAAKKLLGFYLFNTLNGDMLAQIFQIQLSKIKS